MLHRLAGLYTIAVLDDWVMYLQSIEVHFQISPHSQLADDPVCSAILEKYSKLNTSNIFRKQDIYWAAISMNMGRVLSCWNQKVEALYYLFNN